MTPEQNRLRVARDRAEQGAIEHGGGGPSARNLGFRIDSSKAPSGRRGFRHYGKYRHTGPAADAADQDSGFTGPVGRMFIRAEVVA